MDKYISTVTGDDVPFNHRTELFVNNFGLNQIILYWQAAQPSRNNLTNMQQIYHVENCIISECPFQRERRAQVAMIIKIAANSDDGKGCKIYRQEIKREWKND